MARPGEIYDLMLDIVALDDAMIEELIIGLTWTYCRSTAVGLCMTADSRSRSFEWPGTIKGQSVRHLASWIRDWDPMKSTIALAAINSTINPLKNLNNFKSGNISLINGLRSTPQSLTPNLSIFDYFLPIIRHKKCAVIGHYPGIEKIQQKCSSMDVIELMPFKTDLPSPASEYILPEAEWVFLSGTSIANKTFPRLMELSKNANVVLMGPSVPWIQELSELGVDFLAGVIVCDEKKLKQTVSEGGGVNIFSQAVQYQIVDLGQDKMRITRDRIKKIANKREVLKDEMGSWYQVAGNAQFPKSLELIALDKELSSLDTQYKQMWDLRQNFGK